MIPTLPIIFWIAAAGLIGGVKSMRQCRNGASDSAAAVNDVLNLKFIYIN